MAYAPDVFAEVDTYWAKVGGACPVMAVAKLGCRAPLLHIKDGPAVKDKAMTAVGKGTLDWRGSSRRSNHLQWMIVELDSCDTGHDAGVVDSYAYLVGNGLATGRSRGAIQCARSDMRKGRPSEGRPFFAGDMLDYSNSGRYCAWSRACRPGARVLPVRCACRGPGAALAAAASSTGCDRPR